MLEEGDEVELTKDRTGIVRYKGALDGKIGIFYGIELTKGTGTHSGVYKSKRYFMCQRLKGTFVQRKDILFKLVSEPIDDAKLRRKHSKSKPNSKARHRTNSRSRSQKRNSSSRSISSCNTSETWSPPSWMNEVLEATFDDIGFLEERKAHRGSLGKNRFAEYNKAGYLPHCKWRKKKIKFDDYQQAIEMQQEIKEEVAKIEHEVQRIEWEQYDLEQQRAAMEVKERAIVEKRRIALQEEAERLRLMKEEHKKMELEIQREKERLQEEEEAMKEERIRIIKAEQKRRISLQEERDKRQRKWEKEEVERLRLKQEKEYNERKEIAMKEERMRIKKESEALIFEEERMRIKKESEALIFEEEQMKIYRDEEKEIEAKYVYSVNKQSRRKRKEPQGIKRDYKIFFIVNIKTTENDEDVLSETQNMRSLIANMFDIESMKDVFLVKTKKKGNGFRIEFGIIIGSAMHPADYIDIFDDCLTNGSFQDIIIDGFGLNKELFIHVWEARYEKIDPSKQRKRNEYN